MPMLCSDLSDFLDVKENGCDLAVSGEGVVPVFRNCQEGILSRGFWSKAELSIREELVG